MQALTDHKPFGTIGTGLWAHSYNGSFPEDTFFVGELRAFEFADLATDLPCIDYIVYSGHTPIAWHTTNGKDHRVKTVINAEHQALVNRFF